MEQLLYIIFLLFSFTIACVHVIQKLKISDTGLPGNWYNISLNKYRNCLADNQPQIVFLNPSSSGLLHPVYPVLTSCRHTR